MKSEEEIKIKMKEISDRYFQKNTSNDGRVFFIGELKALEWVLEAKP
jgi:hypothetical protein